MGIQPKSNDYLTPGQFPWFWSLMCGLSIVSSLCIHVYLWDYLTLFIYKMAKETIWRSSYLGLYRLVNLQKKNGSQPFLKTKIKFTRCIYFFYICLLNWNRVFTCKDKKKLSVGSNLYRYIFSQVFTVYNNIFKIELSEVIQKILNSDSWWLYI